MLPRVLFVCVENSNRSQMAEAFAHIHGDGKLVAESAGSYPCGFINTRAVQFMAERGYDLNRHWSKPLSGFDGHEIDTVVFMGCGDGCPRVFARIIEDWNLPDPKHMTDDDYRRVRDDIELRVLDLLDRMRNQPTHAPGR